MLSSRKFGTSMELTTETLPRKKINYWDGVTKTWRQDRPQILWRAHSDAVNIGLMRQWLPEVKIERLLKTDLFDELLSDGLFPILRSRAKNVIGMDISFYASRSAKKKYFGVTTLGADTRSLPFTGNIFDVVVSNSTLDHFDSTEEIISSLREFRRVLKPNGQLLLTLDNPVNPIIALRNALPYRLLHRTGIVPYYVGKTLGPKQIRQCLKRLDFEVVEMKALMHCPRVIAVAASRIFQRHASLLSQKKFLKILCAFERMSHWPTRFLTGHFIAVKARKRPEN